MAGRRRPEGSGGPVRGEADGSGGWGGLAGPTRQAATVQCPAA